MRILFLDDSKVTRAVMGQTLRFHRHEVFTAADAGEARSLLDEHEVDLIISDLLMPGVDGIEFTRWVRTHPALKNTPVLLITAAGDDDGARERARQAGVDHFIPKTFSPEEMADAIDKALESLPENRKE